MKEYFIVKRITQFGLIDYYTGARVEKNNPRPDITTTTQINRSYRFDFYEQASTIIGSIARDGELYQIEKLFVKA